MMKKCRLVLVVLALAAGSYSHAASLSAFNVDSGPNIYGSPQWATWWASTQQDVVTGNFQDMRSSVLGTPGDLFMDPYDEMVYSTGDLGNRLHWVYWIEGASKDQLNGLFEVRFVFDWDGIDYTYDWGTSSYVAPDANAGWSQPGSWVDYSYVDSNTNTTHTGVIGTFGFAWWPGDNEALPYSTDGNAYNETNQDDIDAFRDVLFDYQTFARGEVRYRDSITDSWTIETLQVNLQPSVVPVPAAAWMGFLGIGMIAARRRLKKA